MKYHPEELDKMRQAIVSIFNAKMGEPCWCIPGIATTIELQVQTAITANLTSDDLFDYARELRKKKS